MPRQSHENLKSHPDHGSYKLTLNSNEDCIHLPPYNGQLHLTKINNLPDVLPIGVELKSVSTKRYNSNTTLNNGNGGVSNSVINNEHQHYYHHQHHQHHHNSNSNNISSYSNGKMNAMMNSTKHISQSTIVLKRAHHLFNDNVCHPRMTNTESMGNLLDCSEHRQSSPPNLQQMISITNEQRTQITSTNLTVAQHNAMNTNGLVQPPLQSYIDKVKMIRCNNSMDSLLTARDQNAKISQLQNKLLSSQRIHHANIAEINGDDTFNNSFSTDDSNLSELSSESVSSVELSGGNSNNHNNETVTKSDAKIAGDNNQLVDTIASIKLNETITIEVGSQTDESILNDINFITTITPIKLKTEIVSRSKLTDEFDCRKLTESLVEQLSPNDRLRNILGELIVVLSSCEYFF